MMGKYTSQAIGGISADRTKKAADIIKKNGGQLKAAYALLGEADLLLIVDLPDTTAAVKVSISLNKLTGIGFNTSPAMPVEEFDKLTVGL